LDEEDGRCFDFVPHAVQTIAMDQFEAAQTGNLQQLRALLTPGNIDDTSEGLTALHNAAIYGQVECISLCVSMGANVNIQARDGGGGMTPLCEAATYGNLDVVRVLLDANKVDVDAPDDFGWTPLRSAIHYDRRDIARLLIDRGANVSTVFLSAYLPTIPGWISKLLASRAACRCVANIVVAIHRRQLTKVTGSNDINVMKLIGKHIWSTRMDDVWSKSL
jgi:hypothetical protein